MILRIMSMLKVWSKSMVDNKVGGREYERQNILVEVKSIVIIYFE